MTSQPLIGKAALVTGGARRIGREIALELAAAGADVTITYRNSKGRSRRNPAAHPAAWAGKPSRSNATCARSNPCVQPSPHPSISTAISMCWSTTPPSSNPPRSTSSPSSSGTPSSKPTRAAHFLSLAKPCRICAHLAAASSTSARSAACAHGPITPITAHPRPHSTCLRRPWPRPSHLRLQ